MDYSNITGGLRIPSQIPLDVKTFCKNEATLAYLGVDNNLAFTYYDRLNVFCKEEKTTYEWREVQHGEENTGLVPLDFTYPSNTIVADIDYSNKVYNFFIKEYITSDNINDYVDTIVGPPGPQGPQGPSGVSIVESGTSTSVTGSGEENDPFIVNLENLQKIISDFPYTLLNEDNLYTIFVNNNSSNVVIIVPELLTSNFSCSFIQLGTGNVTILESGSDNAEIFIPDNLQNILKGQYYGCAIEKQISTGNYYLIGNLKPI